ncbi:hypothetical protein BC834DRAFT_924884 [Gloeopeniophorella convolvens]|nr:hypothetical protein BC834DRAFT_924884 [Gloeopeniophorella convolvens]
MAPAPRSLLGSLADFEWQDETTHIGTRFPSPNVQLSSFLTASNADDLLRDLATLVSHRGVVFFSNQDITVEQQKQLGQRLGELSGKPATSKLHVHPITQSTAELGEEISVISSKGGLGRVNLEARTRASNGWHADITFEPIPSDYAILKLHTLPAVGGDTLWASGYEAYDRLSPAFQRFLEGLTALHDGNFFVKYAESSGLSVQEHRGAPENVGTNLSAVHPVIRTNPVTGYKTLFVNRSFTKRIVELSEEESNHVLEYLFRHVAENHDFQVRYRWKKNDIAIWDNRSNFHTATHDYTDEREGNRVVSLGEKPFFDAKSKSRREDLGL